MKYSFLCIFILSTYLVQAQESFLKKDLLISVGANLIKYGKFSYDRSDPALKSLPISFSIEYGINSKWSVGIFGGYFSRQYRFLDSLPNEATGSRVFKSRYLPFGLKGTFHFSQLLEKSWKRDINSEALDLYVSGMAGYRYNFLNHADGTGAESKSKPVFGAVLGLRYYWNYRFAMYAELGPSIFGIVGLGITTRF